MMGRMRTTVISTFMVAAVSSSLDFLNLAFSWTCRTKALTTRMATRFSWVVLLRASMRRCIRSKSLLHVRMSRPMASAMSGMMTAMTRVSWALMVMATARAATSMTTARTSIRSAMATII